MRHVHPPYKPGTHAKTHRHRNGNLMHAHVADQGRYCVANGPFRKTTRSG